MNQLDVINIQRLSLHDGPGIRTTVFLKGCFLQCPWCCNPESISEDKEWFFQKDKCLYVRNTNNLFCKDCEFLGGRKSKYSCLFSTFIPVSKRISVDDLFMEIIKDEDMFDGSHGGVTFSGGEPFKQADNLLPLLRRLKHRHIHVAFETSAYCPSLDIKKLLCYIDQIYIDVKFQYGLFVKREYHNKQFSFDENLKLIQHANIPVLYRMVYFRNAFDKKEKVIDLINKCHKYGIQSLELLIYHELGKKKYEQLNREFHHFDEPSASDVKLITGLLNAAGIKYNILKI